MILRILLRSFGQFCRPCLKYHLVLVLILPSLSSPLLWLSSEMVPWYRGFWRGNVTFVSTNCPSLIIASGYTFFWYISSIFQLSFMSYRYFHLQNTCCKCVSVPGEIRPLFSFSRLFFLILSSSAHLIFWWSRFFADFAVPIFCHWFAYTCIYFQEFRGPCGCLLSAPPLYFGG